MAHNEHGQRQGDMLCTNTDELPKSKMHILILLHLYDNEKITIGLAMWIIYST